MLAGDGVDDDQLSIVRDHLWVEGALDRSDHRLRLLSLNMGFPTNLDCDRAATQFLSGWREALKHEKSFELFGVVFRCEKSC